jgi:hypothetical protein
MNPTTFEQLPITRQVLGMKASFLQPGVRLPVETIEERAIGLVFPESVDLRVPSTAQPMHQRETSALKKAMLENGMEVLVPLFIKEGELIRTKVATGKYLDRVKESPEGSSGPARPPPLDGEIPGVFPFACGLQWTTESWSQRREEESWRDGAGARR